jgi:hypothetical protein
MNNKTVFGMDPRINKKDKTIGDITKFTLKTNPDFTCATTTDDGFLATGSSEGILRLYSGVPGMPKSTKGECPKSAKTLFDLGKPIKGIDVTADSQYIMATAKDVIFIVDTVISNSSGFQTRMGKSKPTPIVLKLHPEDVKKIGGSVNFKTAKFNTGKLEEWIVTSTGSYIISWDFKKVKKNQDLYSYSIKDMKEIIVDEQFISVAKNTPVKNAPVILVTENNVQLQKRIHPK